MYFPILIPSRGRAHDVITIDRMPKEFWGHVTLCVPVEEKTDYQRKYADKVNVISVSDYHNTISEKRQKMAEWVLNSVDSPKWFWMMDDDLTFFERIPETTRLTKIEGDMESWTNMWSVAESIANDRTMCAIGISLRGGNNNMPIEGAWNTRLIRCGLFNTEVFLNAEHNRLKFMGDFDVMLQMLRMGYDNHVISRWAQDHRATNATGGCETSRTEEVMVEVADGLEALHEGFVKTKWKANKSGHLKERKDVTVQWKKARASADL